MKTEPKPIESEQIAIETFSVTIKAIQVNKKQMTQAVFRQLPTGKEDTSSELWGIVKYSQIASYSGLWLVFSRSGKLFRRELDLNQKYISHGLLSDLKRKLDEHHRFKSGQYMDQPGYWEEQAKTYSAEHVRNERARHEKERQEYVQKTKSLQSEIEKEEQVLFDLEKKEVNRYSYEHGLVKKLPQLFIAV